VVVKQVIGNKLYGYLSHNLLYLTVVSLELLRSTNHLTVTLSVLPSWGGLRLIITGWAKLAQYKTINYLPEIFINALAYCSLSVTRVTQIGTVYFRTGTIRHQASMQCAAKSLHWTDRPVEFTESEKLYVRLGASDCEATITTTTTTTPPPPPSSSFYSVAVRVSPTKQLKPH